MGMTIALLFSLGTCFVQIQSVRVNFACTKRLQSLGRSDYQCPQCASVCQVRNIPFEDQKTPFSCRLVKKFTFLKRVQSQQKMLLEMSIILANIVLTERNENLLTVM